MPLVTFCMKYLYPSFHFRPVKICLIQTFKSAFFGNSSKNLRNLHFPVKNNLSLMSTAVCQEAVIFLHDISGKRDESIKETYPSMAGQNHHQKQSHLKTVVYLFCQGCTMYLMIDFTLL